MKLYYRILWYGAVIILIWWPIESQTWKKTCPSGSTLVGLILIHHLLSSLVLWGWLWICHLSWCGGAQIASTYLKCTLDPGKIRVGMGCQNLCRSLRWDTYPPVDQQILLHFLIFHLRRHDLLVNHASNYINLHTEHLAQYNLSSDQLEGFFLFLKGHLYLTKVIKNPRVKHTHQVNLIRETNI